MTRAVCVLTAGHLATCPRMHKAVEALADAGYRARIVSTRFMPWAREADRALARAGAGRWSWTEVRYDRTIPYLWSSLRHHAAQRLAGRIGPARCPLPVAVRAYGRYHSELVRAALAEPAHLYYGGTSTGIAAAAAAARRAGARFAADLEDFHSGEQEETPAGRFANALAARIERALLGRAALLTAGSAAIAEAYRADYGVAPIPIHNTFPLPAEAPDLAPSAGPGLRLCWISQTVGPARGLEDAVRAMGRAGLGGELHLRGVPVPGYLDGLRRLAGEAAPGLRIAHEPPAPDASPVALCRGFDVGLALEQGHIRNRALCLTNKAFTYPLAGVAVAFTDTPGQRALARDLGAGAILAAPGDVAALAAGLARWAADRAALGRAKAAAWEGARRRWHWEHAEERGALVAAIARALPPEVRQ